MVGILNNISIIGNRARATIANVSICLKICAITIYGIIAKHIFLIFLRKLS